MGIPAFDDAGNLAEGLHDATLDEIRERLVEAFAGSRTRLDRVGAQRMLAREGFPPS